MSNLKVVNMQIGVSAIAANNFTLYQPVTPDGTVRIGIGIIGAVVDSMQFNADGSVQLAASPAVTDKSLKLATTSTLVDAMQKSASTVVVAGGTVDAITATFVPAITALSHGMLVMVRATGSNTVVNPTLAVNGTPVKTIVKGNNLPLSVADITGSGHWLQFQYDLTLDKYILQNPGTGISQRTGEIFYVPANIASGGSLKLNGALLSRTTYAGLWAYAQASGNLAANDGAWVAGQFSPGDGSTTFRIPDGRAEFIRGWDDSRGVDTGRTIGSTQVSQNISHTHGVTDPTHTHSVYDPAHSHSQNYGDNYGTSGGSPIGSTGNLVGYAGFYTGAAGTGISLYSAATGISLATSGGTEARPRNIAMLACIRY
jgi:microcystin-dependent protein